MSGLAYYLEDEGLSTVVVALVRGHVVKMRPPRALWVPFELGRPFGPPNEVGLQSRILKSALALLDSTNPGPILQDFSDEAPDNYGDTNWLSPSELDDNSAVSEAASLLPRWLQAQARFGKTTVGVSGLDPQTAVGYIERYHSDDPVPNPKGMAAVSRARFAIDDIKAYYFECAAATGKPSSMQINDWFWNRTLAGKMILGFQHTAHTSEDKNLRAISASLVPAERLINQY